MGETEEEAHWREYQEVARNALSVLVANSMKDAEDADKNEYQALIIFKEAQRAAIAKRTRAANAQQNWLASERARKNMSLYAPVGGDKRNPFSRKDKP